MRPCQDCKTDISARHSNALRCVTCAPVAKRRHTEAYKALNRTHDPNCCDCAGPILGARADRQRCDPCGRAYKAQVSRQWTEHNQRRAYERARAYRQTNPERSRAYGKSYRSKNPEGFRMRARLKRHMYRHQERDSLTAEQWSELRQLYLNRCAYCFSEAPLTIDHFIPIKRGGTNDVSNIVPACSSCNSGKQAHVFLLWFARRNGRIARLPRGVVVS